MTKEKAAGGGQASSVPLFLLFPHESLRWIRVGALSPLQPPLKRPRRGLRPPPSLDFPRSSVCAEIISDLQNAIQMRIWQTGEVIEILCGCSGCILYGRACCVTAFRLSYVKYSTGAKSDLHGLSCAWETRFYGRPKGVLTTETKRQNARQNDRLFRRVSAISRPASLFCMLFSDKPEKSMSAKRYRTNWVQKGGCNAIPASISRRAVGPQSH